MGETTSFSCCWWWFPCVHRSVCVGLCCEEVEVRSSFSVVVCCWRCMIYTMSRQDLLYVGVKCALDWNLEWRLWRIKIGLERKHVPTFNSCYFLVGSGHRHFYKFLLENSKFEIFVFGVDVM